MSVDLGFAIGLPPEDAIKYFESKGLKLTGDWRELWQNQHAKAFTVARVAKLDILKDFHSAIEDALKNGSTERDFVKRLTPILQAKGWWGKAIDPATGEILETYDDISGRPVEWGSPRRLKLIYRQNMQTAYMAGRYKRQMELANAEGAGARPYWQYVAVRDSRTRPTHSALHGRVWRADDPIWNYLYPPNGWNCRCRVRALSEFRMKKEGLTPESSDGQLVTMQVSAGKLPDGTPDMRDVTGIKIIDRNGKPGVMLPDAGWSYNPGNTGMVWRGLLDAAESKVSAYAASVGAASHADLRDVVRKSWADWIERALSGEERNKLGWLGILGTYDMAILNDAGITPLTAEIKVKPGIVHGPKADRHLNAGDALTDEQWRTLPELFYGSQALLLDMKSGKPIYLLPGDGDMPQLAVQVDYVTNKPKSTANTVVSAYKASINELKQRLKRGELKLLRGGIE